MNVFQTHKAVTWSNDTQFHKIREYISYWMGVAALNRFTKLRLELDVQWAAPLPNGPKIFACNHPTTTDPFYLLSVLPEKTRIMVNALIFKKPVLGSLMRRSGHIPVDQTAGRSALEAGIRSLQAGDNLGIFPEGALSDLDSGIGVNLLKTGAVRMALSTGVPIIPVGVFMPVEDLTSRKVKVGDKRVISRFYLNGRYCITFGQPLWLNGEAEDRPLVHKFGEELRTRMLDLIQLSALRLRNGLPLKSETKSKKKSIMAKNQA